MQSPNLITQKLMQSGFWRQLRIRINMATGSPGALQVEQSKASGEHHDGANVCGATRA